MVISRAQARREQLEDKELQRKQLQSEVQPHILEDEEDSSEVSHTQSDEEETSQSIQPVHEHFMDINEESTLTSKSPQESKSNLGDLYNLKLYEGSCFTPKLSIIHDL